MRITNSFEILFEVTLHKYTHTLTPAYTHTRCLTRTLRLAAQCPDAENLSKTRRQNVKNLSFCLLCCHFPLTLTLFPVLPCSLSCSCFSSAFSAYRTQTPNWANRENFALSPFPPTVCNILKYWHSIRRVCLKAATSRGKFTTQTAGFYNEFETSKRFT